MKTLLWVAFLVCLMGWLVRIRPLEPVWGTVGEWAAALATGLGLLLTARSVALASESVRAQTGQRVAEEARRQEEESARREAMARAVAIKSSWIEDAEARGQWAVQYEVVNGGDYPKRRW
jgi:hypothetical protein